MHGMGYMQQYMQRGLSNAVDVLPHYARPRTWMTPLRVLLAFLFPLFLCLFIGVTPTLGFAQALACGMLSLTDPRGSVERRGVTILVSVIGGILTLYLGLWVGSDLILKLLFYVILGFILGIMQDFGTAGVQAGFFWISCGFMGSTTSSGLPLIGPLEIASAGVWSMALAFIFAGKTWQKKTLSARISGFKTNIKEQLLGNTPVGRAAWRIAIAVGLAISLTILLGFNQPEWAAGAAMGFFYPTSPVIYKRSARFFIGVFLAVVISFMVITLVKNTGLTAIIMGFALFFTAALREVNYAAFSFLNTLFYILVLMLTSGVGGAPLLYKRLIISSIGIIVALSVAMLTLPARERMAMLLEMGLPLPTNEPIDDPLLANIRTRQVLEKLYHPHFAGHSQAVSFALHGDDSMGGQFDPCEVEGVHPDHVKQDRLKQRIRNHAHNS